MPVDLERFIDAQRETFSVALDELRAGRKRSHWMWFVFPQLRGLGRSETSRYFGIEGLVEAQAYLAHPVLGPRLRQTFESILGAPGEAEDILGSIDAMKLRSSATLFARAAPDDPLFSAALKRFFDGAPDPATDALLGAAGGPLAEAAGDSKTPEGTAQHPG